MLEDYQILNDKLLALTPRYKQGEDYFDIDDDAIKLLKNQAITIISDIAKECGFSESFTITGRQNPMMPGKNNSPHHHPDCMLAVVYYIRVPAHSGDILLHDPRGSILWQDPQARTDVTWKSYRPYHKITPVPGMLLIFPGYVIHSVENNLSNDLRLSIAISTRFE
jgi:hypothetical protein